MADQLINNKFWNVSFDTILTSSEAKFSSSRLLKEKDRIPHRFKHGSSSKENGGFFDESLITSDDHLKVVKLSSSFNYVGLRFDKFQTMVLNHMSTQSSSTSSFQQMSASFFSDGGFGTALPTSSYLTLIAEDGEGGTLSPTYTLSSASGIVNANGYVDLIVTNTSDFNTAATWSFSPGGGSNELHQSTSISGFPHRFFYTGSVSSAFALTGSESGSQRGIGSIKYINNVDTEDGTYLQYLVKGKIYGDGDFGTGEVSSSAFSNTSSVTFLPIREIIIHSGSTYVRSGSFKYNSSSINAASQSGIPTTLYYQSGSNGPSGSYTGSGALSGSHIYLNSTLTIPASSGYYAVPGNLTQILYVFKGGVNSDLVGTASNAVGQIEYQIPRFTSSSILS